MQHQMIMARSLPEEVTQGTLEGDLVPGDITFFRLQSTADAKLRAYIANGEVLPVKTRSFGSIGVFAIPEMGRFYRHVLIQKRYPHHGAVAFAHCGKALFEVLKYLGISDISYNQPKRYSNISVLMLRKSATISQRVFSTRLRIRSHKTGIKLTL